MTKRPAIALIVLLVWLAATVLSLPASAGALGAGDIAAWQQAVDAADRGDRAKARAAIAGVRDKTLLPVLDWLDYRRSDSNAGFTAIAAFIDAHPDWPFLTRLRTNAERQLGAGTADLEAARDWLVRNPPVTGDGALAWLSAPTRAGAPAVPADAIARAWIDLDFTPAAEERFYAAFRKVLTSADNNARLDRLIWERRTDAASRMLRRVDSAQAALATARLTLISSKGNVDGAVARVPAALRDAPELWYERLKWRRKAGLDDAARLVLLDPPAAMAALPQWPQGDLWAQEGQILARRALSDGHVSDAYRLAASHKLDAGVEFAESEFLAGWIGLSLLRDTKTALGHFSRLYDNVRFPISRARGAFWAGEAAAAPGATEQARDWYQRASKFPTTYYGQAALKALGEPLPKVRIDAAAAPAAREAFERRDIVAVVRQLGMIDRPEILRSFLLRLMYASEDADEMMLVAELALSVGQPLEGLRAAKRAYREDGALSPFAYPMVALPKLPSVAATTDPALLLALIRQESGFDRQATSGAGARGMMQLLPGTAADVARKLGMDYSMPRLTEDPAYNIQLGSAYFADLLDRFGGEPALALAGYNAGPRNVHRWLATNGTPGQGGLSLNDWIESIPYAETRNYVQRVLEAVPVYRQLLNDPARPTVTVPEL